VCFGGFYREAVDDPERVAENLLHWEEAARLHDTTYFEDGLARDQELMAFEVDELGDLTSQHVCHLQCHIGGNTLALARLGATLVGVDFSSAALAIARRRANETDLGQCVKFVFADVDHISEAVSGLFDGVYVSWGAICWLPNLDRWAHAVNSLLRPGGWLYVADTHPYAMTVRWSDYPYGGASPIRTEDRGDYTSPDAEFEHTRTWEWNHGLGEIVTALVGAGLTLDWLREHTTVAWDLGDRANLVRRADGLWELPDSTLPLSFSLRATKS
jgi:SAM-dependent methyltransferase